jgi:diacylglycerol kinase family enzyme
VAALKTVFLYYHAPYVKIILDNGESFEIAALMISIMNGRRMGGGFLMAPNSQRDDGKFDICIARDVSRSRVFTLIPPFMRGTQMTQKEIRMLRTSSVVVNAIQGNLPTHADGETVSVEGKQITDRKSVV